VLGRVVRTEATDGSVTSQLHYNDLDTYSTDANGNVTHTTKDLWGRIILKTPPTGASTTYDFNVLGQLTGVHVAGKNISISYDMAGHKTGINDPDLGNWQYTYDALGNLTSQTDARGCTTSLTYDALNRLTRQDYSGPGQCATPR
jgi:YD repeat-containing protein